jgi:predicted O-linked N-acetylglucosamine transferase (SPINDLY family)
MNLQLLSEQAIALHQQGRVAEAVLLYAQILAVAPDDIGTLYNHGTALRDLGRLAEALASFESALALAPDFQEALNNCGSVLRHLQRFDEALARFDKALAIAPDQPGLWYNRGLTLWNMKRFAEALASYDKALAIRPDFAEALNNRGLTLWQLQRNAEALASFDQSLAIHPKLADAWNNRGNTLRDLGRLDEAVVSFDRALAINPGIADVWNNRGGALREMKRLEEALASYNKALAINPDLAEALYNRGNIEWTDKRQLEPALRDLERAAAIDPDSDYVRGDLLHLRMHAGDWRDYERQVALINDGVRAGKRVIEPFPYQAISESPADLQACAHIYQHRWPSAALCRMKTNRRPGKIRVGYVSGEFREQATAYLTVGLYECHDKAMFEIVAFDNGWSDGSPVRQRLEAAMGKFINISGLSDSRAAERIRAEEIDILVNLNGYFGMARMGVFALRPAPIQVNYLGFPGTLAAPCMDYILADRIVIPEQERQFYTEHVVTLPGSYQATDSRRPIAVTVPARAAEGLPADGFVFCNFNQSYKLTPAMFAVWMTVLKRVEDSVLWLLESNTRFPDNLRREAARHGVPGERLVFAPKIPPEKHLARLGLADLFLDSVPYNAHTTASDALWAGLPLITCRGSAFAGRVGASLLQAIGMPEMAVESLEDYQALALRLSGDPALLQSVRKKLERNRTVAPLFDTGRFTRQVEAAYAEMVERWQRGESPQSFAVSFT